MESRPERGTIDEAQKAKLIFISLAAVVTILLIISFVYGNKARTQRDAALKEVEALKQDNAPPGFCYCRYAFRLRGPERPAA